MIPPNSTEHIIYSIWQSWLCDRDWVFIWLHWTICKPITFQRISSRYASFGIFFRDGLSLFRPNSVFLESSQQAHYWILMLPLIINVRLQPLVVVRLRLSFLSVSQSAFFRIESCTSIPEHQQDPSPYAIYHSGKWKQVAVLSKHCSPEPLMRQRQTG